MQNSGTAPNGACKGEFVVARGYDTRARRCHRAFLTPSMGADLPPCARLQARQRGRMSATQPS